MTTVTEPTPEPVLVRKSLAQILTFWRPGSHDWSWAEEYADLMDDPVTDRVRACVDERGIGFSDHTAPVLLGSDGRVWDGHHRICIAIERDITHLMVEVATGREDDECIDDTDLCEHGLRFGCEACKTCSRTNEFAPRRKP